MSLKLSSQREKTNRILSRIAGKDVTATPKLVLLQEVMVTHRHARRRKPISYDVPVEIRTYVHPSKYMPHQGEREMKRRRAKALAPASALAEGR
jgi:hypothetical protein